MGKFRYPYIVALEQWFWIHVSGTVGETDESKGAQICTLE